MSVKFSNPYILLLLIPFVVIITFFYVYEKKKKPVGMKRQKLFFAVRCIMGLLLILALSGMHITWTNKMITTVFLVDVSDSADAYKMNITEYLRQSISNKPKDNQVGIVAFGKNSTVEQFISEVNSFTEFTSNPVKNATDIESAINYATAIMPPNTAKRIVIITDGHENVGDIKNCSTIIKNQNIELNTIILEDKETQEVYISDMNIPDKISIGETFSITTKIESNVVCQGEIFLYAGRTVKGSQKVNIQKGTNTFVFNDTHSDVGLKNYRVVLKTDDDKDNITLNNEYVSYAMVDTKPRVLVIEGKSGEATEFAKLLDSIGIEYTLGNTEIAPSNINELNEYKCIFLADVYADDLNNGFMDNIESYVKNYGGSLIASGGENSFALGMYRDTALEKILPVDMDLKQDKEIPKMAMALVIDHSSSMTGSEVQGISKLDLAKMAAVSAVETLRETDEIGILQFSDTYKWVFKPKLASDKEELSEYISGIQCQGGTSIYPALEEATKTLKKSDAKLKHIILLTDGQDGYDGYNELLKDINDSNITLSTVASGADSDIRLMKFLAEQGNGRYYYTDTSTDIPRIFAQEVFLSAGEYLKNKEFYPVVSNYSNILTGVVEDGLPSLLGYIGATPKDTAKVLLESDEEDPILSIMQCGIGRTVAWNSDVTNEWTANYAGQTIYQNLWNNIMNWTLTDLTEEGTGVSVSEDTGVLTIKYKTDDFDVSSKVTTTIKDEDGKEEEFTMNPISPGEYKCEVDADKTGIYSVNVKESKGKDVINAVTTSAVVQYSREYRIFEYADDFEAKVTAMGANIKTFKDDVFNSQLKKKSGSINISEICLLIALILFAIDIVFRRLELNVHLKNLILKYKNTYDENKKLKEAEEILKEQQKIQKEKEEYDNAKKQAEELKNKEKLSRKEQKQAKKLAKTGLKGIEREKENLNVTELLDRQKKRNN